MRRLSPTALAPLLALAACGDGSPASPASTAAPRCVKLVDVATAVLSIDEASREDAAVESVLDEDFDEGWGAWRFATDSEDAFAWEDGVLEKSIGSEGGESFLTLGGTRGLAYRVVAVEPSTPYEFRALLRARDLEAEEPFFGATAWLAELTRFGTPEEVLGEGPEKYVDARHLFPSVHRAGENAGWKEQQLLFWTGPETRALLVTANFSFTQDVGRGAVDFASFRLERVAPRTMWNERLGAALSDYVNGEPPFDDWRGERLIRGQLGAEIRPSILSFPRESLAFPVYVPTGSPRLSTGIGPWTAAVSPGADRASSFLVRVDGSEVARRTVTAPTDPADARWTELHVDLSRWAGKTARLELSVEGELPGLFGAPQIRDTSRRPDVLNVLLISIDTLRADFVGCYGARSETNDPTPNLDALAADGIRFAHVVGQAPYTLPGHATMLSGQFPSVHGVQRTTNVLSSSRSPLLARILGDAGYRTQAFTGGGFVNADFGFDKGFDGFANIDPLRQRDARFFQQILDHDLNALRRLRRNSALPDRVTRELIDEYGPERVQEWLADHASEPFFLFVHTYSVHDYDPPARYLTCAEEGCTSKRVSYEEHRLTRRLGWNPQPISEADAAHLRHRYAAALRFADELVGELFDKLDELGLRDNTIVAVTTDHGEEMFERGFMQHGKTLYEELTNLPLLLRVPGMAPRVIDEPAMLADLTPTILGRLGLPRDQRMQGIDLLREGGPQERATWSEIHDDFVHKYALRSGGWKLIHAPHDPEVDFPAPNEWELYDLLSDEGELTDLSEARPDELERMQAELEENKNALQALAERLGETGTSEIDEETLKQLRELGYVE